MRIDKIRKNNTSNLIDLDISRFDLKFDDTNYSQHDKCWQIAMKTYSNHINLLKVVNNYEKQIQLIKELKHFFKIQLLSVSEATISTYFSTFIPFMYFVNNNKISVNRIHDINNQILVQYTEYLNTQKSAQAKYRDLKNILTKISQTKNIVVHEDIKNKNYPQVKINKNRTSRENYSHDDFKSFSKTIVNILEDYLIGSEKVNESLFVRASYWFISICTGFNETGLLSLTKDSFEHFDDSKNILTVIGEKNRSSQGHQFSNILFNDDSNCLLKYVLDKLFSINIHNDTLSLFSYKMKNKINIYDGKPTSLLMNSKYKEYALANNCLTIPSTYKIRNYRSLYLYDKSKNEKLVSELMNHRTINTTIQHYIKQNLGIKDYLGLFLVQNLLESFSKNESFDDWILFQKHFDLKNSEQNIIVKNINNGSYNSPLGSCIKDVSKEPCTSYINCFKCKHYSVIGERDLWKIMSFRECLNEFISETKTSNYQWLSHSINSILSNFNGEQIKQAKIQLKNGRHPFWKNNLMLKNIINDYEAKI